MSRYSGKCDVFDSFACYSGRAFDEEKTNQKIENTVIMIGSEYVIADNMKELALYFPYTIGIALWCNDCGISKAYISEVDYIRQREIQVIELYVDAIKREKKRLRRRHEEYIVNSVYERVKQSTSEINKDAVIYLIEQLRDKNKVDVSNIRLKSLEYYRDVWFDDLVNKYGYDEEFSRKWVWHLDEFNNCWRV